MLHDTFGRPIHYLRISVTDRCNYRCTYCMPPEGIVLKSHSRILSLERIAEVARVAGSLGFTKVRLTGGEPLVRRNIETLVAHINECGAFRDIAMTTNAALLTPSRARLLHDAGLHRVNVSLDTLDPGHFSRLTRGGDIGQVLRGIDAALEAGLSPIKVNMIVFASTSPSEVDLMQKYCGAKGLVLQTIRHFDLNEENLPKQGAIVTDRPYRCEGCNRLRLTADGYLRSCLHADLEYPVDFSDIAGSIRTAVAGKPLMGTGSRSRAMNQIGG